MTHTTGQELMKLIPLRVPASWPEQASDIAVITLTRNAPPDVPRYSLYGRTDEVGRTAVLTGFGLTGHGSTGEDDEFDGTPKLRAGLNRIEAVDDELRGAPFLVADFDSGLPENNSLELLGVPSDLRFRRRRSRLRRRGLRRTDVLRRRDRRRERLFRPTIRRRCKQPA